MAGIYQITSELESQIELALQSLGLKLQDSQKIADSVLRMSDFYIENPSLSTPWKESWAQIAQIAYYLPLNFLRSQAVAHEILKAQKKNLKTEDSHSFFQIQSLLDYGAGLGAGSLAFSSTSSRFAIEKSPMAVQLAEKFFLSGTRFINESEVSRLHHLTGLFSYSLTELPELPKWAFSLEQIIIIEPATQEDGRRLLGFRQQLLEKGFQILAPCTHQGTCPLLTQSKTDWCHDRIGFEAPEWFLEIENHLPIKNSNLTFSYLVAQKTADRKAAVKNEVTPKTPHQKSGTHSQLANQISQGHGDIENSPLWRIIGDPLEERGKTRQMVCRGENREFLAWLHRHGNPATFERGQLIEPSDFSPEYELKSNELRKRPSIS